jgi:hypothetical protein
MMIRASRKASEDAKYSDESSSSSDLDSNLNISDIEDNQGGGASAAFEYEFMQEEEEEEEQDETACAGGGDRQLERLANQYMMKSPATMAMRRKSSIEPAGAAGTLLSLNHLSKGGILGTQQQ